MTAVGNLDMAVIPTAVAVASETDPDTVYQVQLPYCPCKDWRYRRAHFDGDFSSLFCKHLRTALERVSGWHSAPPAPEVHAPLTHVEVKELLQGSKVGFQPREANGVLARAAANEIAEFRTRLTGGPLVDGTVEFNRLHGTYRVTIVR